MAESLDPDTVERVVRRAQELTTGRATGRDVGEPGTIEESVLVEAAAEAGIDPAALRQALALERLDAGAAPARGDRILGPPSISRTRVLDVDADEVLRRLDAWITASGRLVAVRRTDGAVEWVPRTGVWAALHRLRRPPLTPSAQEADRLVAEVRSTGDPSPGGPTSSPSSVVRLTVDRRTDRRSTAGSGLAVSGAGLVGSVAALTVLVPGFLLVSVPAVGLGAWLTTGGRRRADAVGAELDKLLDVVAAGDRPPSVTDRLRRRPVEEDRAGRHRTA